MPDEGTAAVLEAGAAGEPTSQGGDEQVAGLQRQVADLQKRLDSIPQAHESEETSMRAQFDGTANASLLLINRMPDGPEKREARITLGEAALREKARRDKYEEDARGRRAAQTVAQQRDSFIDDRVKELGLGADEADIIKAAALPQNALDTEAVNKIIAPFEKRARAGTGGSNVPAIAKVPTDSRPGTAGATKSYEDLLNDVRERQMAGDRKASILDARREARRLGILPGRVGA